MSPDARSRSAAAVRRRLAPVLLGMAVGTVAHGAGAAEVTEAVDPDTTLRSWTFLDGAVSIELVQRLPDQTRAFFQGRGFPAEAADTFGQACVFQAIVRNITPSGTAPTVGIDLATWKVRHGEGQRPLPLEASWQPRWEAAGLNRASRVAFRWALFPTQQAFQPGDYNWGMIPFGPAPGQTFDLMLAWAEDGVVREGRIAGIQCATDR